MKKIPNCWHLIPGHLHYDDDEILRVRFYNPVNGVAFVISASFLEVIGYKVPILSNLETSPTSDKNTVYAWFKIVERKRKVNMSLVSASDLRKNGIEL